MYSQVSAIQSRVSIWTVFTLLSMGVLVLFVVYPITTLLGLSFISPETGDFSLVGYWTFFTTSEYVMAAANSVILGASVTAGCIALGVAMAFVVARYDFPAKNLIAMLPLVTFVLPDIIVAQSWLMLFGNNGVVTRGLSEIGIQLPSFYGWSGLIFVMVLKHYAFAYLMVLTAFRSIDVYLEEAAQNLGSSPLRTYFTVTFPVVGPSILVAAMVVFTLTIDNFGVPVILAQRIPILSVAAYNEFVSELGGDPLMQSTMSMILVAIVTFVLILQKGYVERRVFHMEAGRTPPSNPLKNISAYVVVGILGFVVAISLIPIVIVVFGSFTKSIGPVMHYGEFDLGNYRKVISFAPEAMYNSFFLASVATIVGVFFSILVSYLIVKKRSLLTHGLDFMVMLPLAIAGTVLGIALVNAYNAGPVVLTGTWMIMAIAYFVRRVPFSIGTASATLHSIKGSIEEASINMGVPPIKTFIKVIVPLMKPAVVAAAILMWVTTLSELSATIVLYYGGLTTMPIQIFQQIDSGVMGLASAYGTILIISIFVPIFVAIKFFKIDVFSAR